MVALREELHAAEVRAPHVEAALRAVAAQGS